MLCAVLRHSAQTHTHRRCIGVGVLSKFKNIKICGSIFLFVLRIFFFFASIFGPHVVWQRSTFQHMFICRTHTMAALRWTNTSASMVRLWSYASFGHRNRHHKHKNASSQVEIQSDACVRLAVHCYFRGDSNIPFVIFIIRFEHCVDAIVICCSPKTVPTDWTLNFMQVMMMHL